MEKEQIIKALKCCSGIDCRGCPYFGHIPCTTPMKNDALALINSQEQKILELENRLKECENGYAGTLHIESCKLHDAEERVKELTEENERLKTENAKYEAENHAEFNKWLKLEEATKRRHSELFEEAKIAVKEDTVRKMQERLKELMGGEFASCGYCNAVGYWSVQSVKKCIDRIADEILNKNTEE